MANDDFIKTDNKIHKQYSYSLADVNLTFSLIATDLTQLTPFKALLERALTEVSADIELLSNK